MRQLFWVSPPLSYSLFVFSFLFPCLGSGNSPQGIWLWKYRPGEIGSSPACGDLAAMEDSVYEHPDWTLRNRWSWRKCLIVDTEAAAGDHHTCGRAQWSHERVPGGHWGSESPHMRQNMAIVKRTSARTPRSGINPVEDKLFPRAHPQGVTSCFLFLGQGPEQDSRGDYLEERKRWTYQCSTSWILHDWWGPQAFSVELTVSPERTRDWSGDEAFACGYCRCHPGIIQSWIACTCCPSPEIMLEWSQAWKAFLWLWTSTASRVGSA